jgi:crotonobetainyl-CoA:carnitine CoA-transferase CaiB-like acyl-CoA transferase
MRHHDEIDRHIEAWTKSRGPAEAEQELQAAGVPAQRMRRVDDILAQRQHSVFHLQPGNPHPALLTGLPFSFVPRRKQTFGPTPRLGEHTEHALKTWLGLEAAEITKLHEVGALS